MKEFYSMKELADVVGVHPRTIREWIDKGKFPAAVYLPNGEKRWMGESIMRWKYGLLSTPPENPVKRKKRVTQSDAK